MSTPLQTILQHAAWAHIEAPAIVRASGPDAARWLNGMATASVQTLAAGEGAYTFFLDAQGRIQHDALIFRDDTAENERTGDAFLLITSAFQGGPLITHLDRFIIMDDVELKLLPTTGATALRVLGPEAQERLANLDLAVPGDALRLVRSTFDATAVLAYTDRSADVHAVTCIADQDTLTSLAAALEAAGMPEADADDLESLRLLEARPLIGRDIGARDLPQETAQTDALHFSKGCYLGQEIVERIHSRGQVHRQLTSLVLTGSLPGALPVPLMADGAQVGQLTSARMVDDGNGPQLLGLGIVRREALLRGPLSYDGGTAQPAAERPHN